jgi:hypothetical protein
LERLQPYSGEYSWVIVKYTDERLDEKGESFGQIAAEFRITLYVPRVSLTRNLEYRQWTSKREIKITKQLRNELSKIRIDA